MERFQKVTPESVGVSSEAVMRFIKAYEAYGFSTHSLILARGEDIFYESYYAPFTQNTLHRMYSVSKSFVTAAVGLAVQEGLMALDAPFMSYLPEYGGPDLHPRFYEATVRDMLQMRSAMADAAEWWGYADRAAAYFTKPSKKAAGSYFKYDSAGSFLLGCIVEKVTGKPLMDYLKEKMLLDLGFSKESYCLLAPGGHAHCDSGVMCTARDLLIYARLFMDGGAYKGKQYLDPDYVKAAVQKQTDNYMGIRNTMNKVYGNGYGYLIWKTPRDGFAFYGMSTQFAICDPQTDIVLIIHSENKGDEQLADTLLYHEFFEHFLPSVANAPLPPDPQNAALLAAFAGSRKLVALPKGQDTDFAHQIDGITYVAEENEMGIRHLRFTFAGEQGTIEYENAEGANKIVFGMGYNEFGAFPGKKRMALTAGQYVAGSYRCAASATWSGPQELRIMVQVIDDYMGKLHILASFKGDTVSLSFIKQAQRILQGYDAHFVAKASV